MKLQRLCSSAYLVAAAFLIWSDAQVFAAQTAAPAPEISISPRGLLDEVVEQGEPIRIVVRLDAPPDSTGAIELAPASGTWTDGIAVELAPVGGGAAVAQGVVVGKPATARATVSATQVAGGLWRISGDAMGRVVPGEYLLRARLTIRGGAGWSGETVSEEMPLSVIALSADAPRVAQRAIARAHEALLEGRTEVAAGMVDPVLERAPNDQGLLTIRALIAERAENPAAAMMCLNRVFRLSPHTGSGQPPIELEEQRSRVMAALMARKENAPEAPAWSWPPMAVLGLRNEDMPVAATNPAAPATKSAVAPPTIGAPAAAGIPPGASAPRDAGVVVRPASAASVATPIATQTATSAAAGISSGPGVVIPAAELVDAKIRADAAGQWAVNATSGSQYGKTQYSAMQAAGAPNVPVQGNSPDAWCPAVRNVGLDWLDLTFAKPTRAVEVRVRQNDVAGAITKVEAFEPNGTVHVWWEGVDPYVAPSVREIVWFAVRVPKTDYLVAKIKLSLNLASGPGYKEIDAVQLVAAEGNK